MRYVYAPSMRDETPEDLELPDSDDTPPALAFAGARHVIAVGAGRSGAGKSLLAQGISVFLAQLGRSVLLVDADPNGPDMHLPFGLPRGDQGHEDGDDAVMSRIRASQTEVSNLQFATFPTDRVDGTGVARGARALRWLNAARDTGADYIVINVGTCPTLAALDLWLGADTRVALTSPEPASVESFYRVLAAGFVRRLRRRLHQDRVKAELFERARRELGPGASPLALVQALKAMDRNAAEIAWQEALRLRCYLVVNPVRSRPDTTLGAHVAQVTATHFGVPVQELGYIDFDESVAAAARRRRPLMVDTPGGKAGRQMERITRRLLTDIAPKPERGEPCLAMPSRKPTHYDVLGVARGATDEEVRKASRPLRALYTDDNLAACTLLSPDLLRGYRARIEEAHDTLVESARRKAYDMSVFDGDMPLLSAPPPPVVPVVSGERELLRREVLREVGVDTIYSGDLLRRVRESQGLGLSDIARLTKIPTQHLASIEDDAFHRLPAAVYVRGYVGEFARQLGLDPALVRATYLARPAAAAAFHR